MARCGCANACGCVIAGADGIQVTGAGSPSNRYIVRFVGGSTAACEAVMDCVGIAAAAGSGLTYNDVTGALGVRLSSDEGNVLAFGSDKGLYSSGGTGPSPDAGGVTVDGLPDMGILCGFRGAGMLIAPESTIDSYETAVEQGLNMADVRVRSLPDGTLVVHAYTTITNMTGLTNAGMGVGLETQTAMRWKALTWRIGDPPGGTDDTTVDATVGFFGFLHPPKVGGPTCSDLFRQVGRRIVLQIEPLDDRAATELLRLILLYGLSKSVIVRTSLELAPLFVGSGIAVAVYRNSNDGVAEDIVAIQAAGIEWVSLSFSPVDGVSDATVRAYVEAGLNVLAWGAHWQFQEQRGRNLGCRGVVSYDPIYTSGDRARYWHKNSSGADIQADRFGNHAPDHGMLSTALWDSAPWYNSSNNMSTLIRGGFYTYAATTETSRLLLPAGTGVRDYGLLMGWMSPLPAEMQSGTYAMSANVLWKSTPTSGEMLGVAVAAPTDAPWGTAAGPNTFSGYYVLLSATGTLYLGKQTNGVSTLLGQVATGLAMATQTNYLIKVTVSPTQVVATCNAKTVTANDTSFRGGYSHLLKRESATAQFVGTFQTVQIV